MIVPIGDDPSNDANTKRIYLNKMLNKFKKKKIVKLRNLLSSGDEVAEVIFYCFHGEDFIVSMERIF